MLIRHEPGCAVLHGGTVCTRNCKPVEKTIEARMRDQRAEFDALDELLPVYQKLRDTPIVDDDYPEARDHYELLVRRFLDACIRNGRER